MFFEDYNKMKILLYTDYGHTKANVAHLQIPIPNNGGIMENMNKVPKWVLIIWPRIPQIPQNLST